MATAMTLDVQSDSQPLGSLVRFPQVPKRTLEQVRICKYDVEQTGWLRRAESAKRERSDIESCPKIARGFEKNAKRELVRSERRYRNALERLCSKHLSLSSASPLEELIEREEIAVFSSILRTALAPRERQMLELKYVDGLSWGEVATSLGSNPSALRSRAQRIRKDCLGRFAALLQSRAA